MVHHERWEIAANVTRVKPLLHYRALHNILKAFSRYHHYAPKAALTFRVSDVALLKEGLHLYIEAEGQHFPISISQEGLFQLPPAARTAHATLYANRPATRLSIYPEIFSPGTTATRRRMGDLRLQCRLSWAAISEDIFLDFKPFLTKDGDPCDAASYDIFLAKPLEMARSMTSAPGEKVPRIMGSQRFAAPVYDASLSNDAIISLR